MEGVVEQYNRDLAKWEQQVKEKEKPNRPPEKESIRDRLRQLQAEGKQQRTRKKSQDRKDSFDTENDTVGQYPCLAGLHISEYKKVSCETKIL